MGVINLSVEQDINRGVAEANSHLQAAKFSDYDYNLYDRTGEVDNYILSGANGSLSEYSNSVTSNYISINKNIYPKLRFFIKTDGTDVVFPNTSILRLYFYDKDFTVVSYATSVTIYPDEINIPDNASYLRISYIAGSMFRDNYRANRVIVIKYACFSASIIDDIKPYVYKENMDGNLFSRDNIVYGRKIQIVNDEVRVIYSGKFSGFIPVIPSTKYVCHNTGNATGYNNMLFFLDEKKNILSYSSIGQNRTVFKTPSNCFFVSFNLGDWFEGNQLVGIYPAQNNIRTEERFEDENVVAYKLNDTSIPFSSKNIILGIYENQVVYRNSSSDGIIHYSSNGLDGDVVDVNVAETFGSGRTVTRVLFFKHSLGSGSYDTRALIFTNDNKVFASTNSTFSAFTECNIWDRDGGKYWNANENDKDPYGLRYRFHFPADIASRQNAFMWHNGPFWIEGQGGQFGGGVMFCNYSNGEQLNTNLGAQCYFTEDGVNIYVQYQFGVYQKYYKIAGDNEVKERTGSYNIGDALDMTNFVGSPTAMTLSVRYNIIPTETTPMPSNRFEYESPIAITNISGQTITLADASTLRLGDTVVLKGTATGDFEKILNNDASGSNGGNCCFVVSSIDGNDITLADAIGNPNVNLMCRHLHGISPFGQGVVIYTGEEYPASWMIYMQPYTRNASHNERHTTWSTSRVNLATSKDAFQRALGMHLRADGDIIYITDSPEPYRKKTEIDGNDIVMANYGLFKIKPDDLNDSSKAMSLITGVCAGYALYLLGNVLLYSDYHGKTYYSLDDGDTWKYIWQDGLWKNVFLGFDKKHTRFYFTNFVIELK